MKTGIVVLLLGLVLMACTPRVTQEQGGESMKQLVALHSVDPKQSFIAITVTGYGCTVASQFKVEAVQEDAVCRVSIYRIQKDHCLRSSAPKSLKIPWDAEKACGKAVVEIVNSQKPAARPPLVIPNNSK